MNCPVCDDTRMREVEKNGILIDVCPSCKGVWLDRGELEKLMSDVREIRQEYNEWYYGDSNRHGQPQRAPQSPPPYPQQTHQSHQPYYGSHPQGHPKYHKKKKSVLDVFGDLFD
ncbi:hypothetical protein GE107_21785 [Cohnella sp. CFH 77786]|uniref:TFIIB-type zinc ribbon-containing protein n=1 Tax=Cohnella sp. CFH 77786 TaxID=2662265 RepID=UPI001C609AFC|nr:zf-TFIIB domain-containing protein [Cohnella sp. CFH 77786]MBW5448680.1 hypothetical protein [Cohnella sp. CFH 77786]